jgi:hypothetical protein
MNDPAKQMKTNQYVVIGMSIVLIFGAISAVTITADEYGPEILVWMYLATDAAMTAILPVLLVQVVRGAEPGGLKTAAVLLGCVGLVAGLVKLAARFSSDHGWWTGHFTYAF